MQKTSTLIMELYQTGPQCYFRLDVRHEHVLSREQFVLWVGGGAVCNKIDLWKS